MSFSLFFSFYFHLTAHIFLSTSSMYFISHCMLLYDTLLYATLHYPPSTPTYKFSKVFSFFVFIIFYIASVFLVWLNMWAIGHGPSLNGGGMLCSTMIPVLPFTCMPTPQLLSTKNVGSRGYPSCYLAGHDMIGRIRQRQVGNLYNWNTDR